MHRWLQQLVTNTEVQDQAQELISKMLNKLEDKGRLEGSAEEITKRITYADDIAEFKSCDLIIEAIVENLQIKKNVFEEIESVVSDTCIIASNTSSL